MIKYSVVTTIYNDKFEAKLLLDDIVGQTYKPDEVIIVDGGSSIESIKYISDLILNYDIDIKYSTGKRLNISQGFNEAIRLAKNSYVMIVAVGNRYGEDCVFNLIETLKNKKLDYAYCPFAGQESTDFSIRYNKVFMNDNKGLKLPIASNHGVLIAKNVFEESGYFYENFIYAGEDEEYYKKIKQEGFNGECVESSLIFWDTPHNRKEYYKQVKNYMIARMQLYGIDDILKLEWRTVLYIALFLLMLICFLVNIKYSIIPLIGVVAINLKWFARYGVSGVYMHNLEMVYKLMTYALFNKYLSKKYGFNGKERYKTVE